MIYVNAAIQYQAESEQDAIDQIKTWGLPEGASVMLSVEKPQMVMTPLAMDPIIVGPEPPQFEDLLTERPTGG